MLKPRIRVREGFLNCFQMLPDNNGIPVVIHKSEIKELTKDNTIEDWIRATYNRQVRNNCFLLAESTASVIR